MKPDYYSILGVKKSSSQTEIKTAYRRLSRKYHPDVNKSVDAGQKFKDIHEAYEKLSDPLFRAQYDRSFNKKRETSGTNYKRSSSKGYSTYKQQQNTTPPKPGRRRGYGFLVWIGVIILISLFQSKSNSFKAQSNNPSPSPSYSDSTYTQPLKPNNYKDPSSNTNVLGTQSQNNTQPQNPNPSVLASPSSEPIIDCIGPDGKHAQATKTDCDNLWRYWATPTPSPVVPQQNVNTYSPDNSSNNCNSCTANSHCSYGSCVCDSGYTKNYNTGQCDKLNCPANSTESYGSCSCNNGFTKNYSTGNCDACPSNSTGQYGSCTCNQGYTKNYSTGQCDKLTCPVNSTESYGSCSCNDGYTKNYSTGQCDACPTNSTGKYGACTCNQGYTKNYSTGQCDVLNCPENSTANSGYCSCNSGYYMDYTTNKCVHS